MAGGNPHNPLHIAWEVERVYAGAPIPVDLIARTPACLWTNLTPGVRYLFSTAATDLDITGDLDASSETPGSPTVADSLAWQLLAGGAVQLAPFDTYTLDAYGDEVRSISTLAEALEAVAPGAGEGTDPAAPMEVDIACTASSPIADLDDASGVTFVGRYIGDETLPGPDIQDVRAFWSVQRVYAGGPLPEVLTLRTAHCAPATVEPGQRYLFTTSDGHAPGAWNALAWRIRPDGSLVLAPLGSLRREHYPSDIRRFDSLGDALDAIPGTSTPTLPLRAADRTPG